MLVFAVDTFTGREKMVGCNSMRPIGLGRASAVNLTSSPVTCTAPSTVRPRSGHQRWCRATLLACLRRLWHTRCVEAQVWCKPVGSYIDEFTWYSAGFQHVPDQIGAQPTLWSIVEIQPLQLAAGYDARWIWSSVGPFGTQRPGVNEGWHLGKKLKGSAAKWGSLGAQTLPKSAPELPWDRHSLLCTNAIFESLLCCATHSNHWD